MSKLDWRKAKHEGAAPAAYYARAPDPSGFGTAMAQRQRDVLDSTWRRSKKGNFYRKLGGEITTVFSQRSGGWKYVRNGVFSEATYLTAREAMETAEDVWSID